MPITTLDERTALILIDLQHGILRLPLLHDRALVLSNAKRHVGAFHAAALPVVFVRVNDVRPVDLQLRRRAVTQVVFAGIAASRGVESSARSAQVRGYNVAFAVDAVSDLHEPSFDHSTRVMFPRLGQVGTTETVVAALRR